MLHAWGHVWGRPSDSGATHSGKGSICSKLIVRQGFCGWPGLRGPIAILFISRDTCNDSIAKLFRACFCGVGGGGYRTIIARYVAK